MNQSDTDQVTNTAPVMLAVLHIVLEQLEAKRRTLSDATLQALIRKAIKQAERKAA